MSSVADSPAKTSAQLEKGKVSPGSDPDSGEKWHALSVKYNPDTSGWRTHHCLFPEDLDWSCLTLPRWGMMRNGELWERITLPPLTSGTDAGSWPTPTSQEAGIMENLVTKDGAPAKPGERAYNPKTGKHTQVTLGRAVAMFPTPQARDWKGTAGGFQNGKDLPGKVGGQLNPNWVEWLMGWPIGWTDLKPLAMDNVQLWYDSHGKPYTTNPDITPEP